MYLQCVRQCISRRQHPFATAEAVTVAWRAEYHPSIELIREGSRGFIDLDILRRENLRRISYQHSFALGSTDSED